MYIASTYAGKHIEHCFLDMRVSNSHFGNHGEQEKVWQILPSQTAVETRNKRIAILLEKARHLPKWGVEEELIQFSLVNFHVSKVTARDYVSTIVATLKYEEAGKK